MGKNSTDFEKKCEMLQEDIDDMTQQFSEETKKKDRLIEDLRERLRKCQNEE